MNTNKKTNTKKTLLVAMALCFMMPAMAQKTNYKTTFEQLKKKAKEVEQINRRAGSYTQKIDSTVYSYGSKDVLQYDEHFNCTKWSSYYYDELSQFIDYEYDAENRVVSQTTIYPSGNSGFKTTMEYDVAGNLTVQTGYAKQNEEWVETSRMIREYDAVGNLTSETSYGKQDGEWVAQSLDTYEYDSEGHVLFMHEYYMNSTTGDWDEFYYDVHNYTNGLHTEFIAYMTNYEGGFIPHRRITWDYNEQQWCVREEYWDWYQDGGGELAYWILANRYDIVYFDNGNVKERISNMVDWVTGDAFPYEKTVYAYDEHNNVTSTNSYSYNFDTSEWSPLFSTVMEYDQSVSVDNIAGFALLFGETTSDYWSSGESTSPYKDKLLKITNFVWWEEEDEVQDVYYSTTTNTGQTLSLSQGWNWFSANVEIILDDLKAALVEALPGTTITIKSQTQNVKYQNGRWTGSLTALDMTQMYMISVTNDCEISLEGVPIDPSGLTVTINNGANWIAFPYNQSMTVTNFFGSFPVNNDQVKSQSQNARYQGNRWGGQLNTLVPGKGYIYNSAATGTRTFVFPASAK